MLLHSPVVFNVTVLQVDVRGREDALGVFVTQGEASIPASTLLQNLNHVSKVEVKERVGFVCAIREDNCREGGRGEREGGQHTTHRPIAIQKPQLCFAHTPIHVHSNSHWHRPT